MRLVCVISSLGAGGAERVMSQLANYFANCDWKIRLITISGTGSDFFYLKKGIDRIALNSQKNSKNFFFAVKNNFQRMFNLRREVLKFSPNLVLVFGARTNILTILSLRGTDIPVVISERTDPFSLNIGFPWHILRTWAYKKSTKIIAQTDVMRDLIKKSWQLNNVVSISNPISNDIPVLENDFTKRKSILLCVGRLSSEKGHDLLLDSWASIKNEFPNWRLKLIGNGPERERLKKRSQNLKISRSIEFVKKSNDIWSDFLSSKIFILPSRREGFPNALLEALSMGCICIASDCARGNVEILENGKLGLLFKSNSTKDLTKAIRKALSMRLGTKNFNYAQKTRKKYQFEKIAKKWMDTLKDAEKNEIT